MPALPVPNPHHYTVLYYMISISKMGKNILTGEKCCSYGFNLLKIPEFSVSSIYVGMLGQDIVTRSHTTPLASTTFITRRVWSAGVYIVFFRETFFRLTDLAQTGAATLFKDELFICEPHFNRIRLETQATDQRLIGLKKAHLAKKGFCA